MAWAIVNTDITALTSTDTTLGINSFTNKPLKGNLLVGVFNYEQDGNGNAITGVTDNGTGTANSWNVQINQTGLATDDNALGLFWCVNQRDDSSITILTLTFGATHSYRGLLFREYSGNAASPFDGANSNNLANGSSGTDYIYSPSILPTYNGDLIIGGCQYWRAPGTMSAGTGFAHFLEDAGVYIQMEDMTQTTAASVAATFTTGGSNSSAHWVALVAAFKAVGGTPAFVQSPLNSRSTIIRDQPQRLGGLASPAPRVRTGRR